MEFKELHGSTVVIIVKELACQFRRHKRHGFSPWKIPWRRAWQPIPIFLPGESVGQRSLAGYSPWGRKESGPTEMTEHARTPAVSFTLGRTTLGERPAEALPASSDIWAGNAGPPGVCRRI